MAADMLKTDCPVLIAGGSLVGLSTALFLASHGVRPLVVERHPGTAIHPRAGVFHQRTQEIWRSVGLEDEIVRRASEEFTQDGAIIAVESLAGKELASFLPSLNEGVRDVSPSLRLYCTQSVLEPVLRRRAEELGATILFGTEMVSFEAGPDGIEAVIRTRGGGDERRVHARYLVAADGNRSPVRERLGISMNGRGTFSRSATVYFRADVRPALRGRPLSVVYVKNATLTGFMRFESNGQSGFLAVNALFGPQGRVPDVAAVADEAHCVQMVRDAIGVPDLDVQIVVVQPWKAAADCAERFSAGCVLLAGDAAHTMPPTGGFGGNTGIADAHNLAWKLALVLAGKAGEALLDTYDLERRPVGAFTAEQAYTRYVKRTDPGLGDADAMPQEDDLHIELGHCYASPAVCLEEGQEFTVHVDPRASRALPGSRAPHLVLERDGETCSTLDLFGRGFVVLAGARGEAWQEAAASASTALGVPVAAHCIGAGDGFVTKEANFEAAYGLEAPEGAVLVRPDGFVAWRSRGAGKDPDAELRAALLCVLCRGGD